MKNRKKLSIVIAMLLVCVVSVAGTLAYLTATTSQVKNTFTASKLIDDPTTNFILDESKANPDASNPGKYILDTNDRVQANEYKVVPGVDIDKDPVVTIKSDKLGQSAYLFIEVVDTLPDTITWTPGSNWVPVTDLATGSQAVGKTNGGKIYAWNAKVNPDATNDQTFVVINGNKLTVAGTYEASATGEEALTFYAYLTQSAGCDTAAAAWEATFGA